MAGRNPQEAVGNYRDPLNEAVACATDPHLILSRRSGFRVGEEYSLALLEGDPVRLPGAARVAISLVQYFQIVEDDRPDYGPYRVRTTAYYYTIEDVEGHEVLAYHWHPQAPNSRTLHPHVHLQYGARVGRRELAGSHVPTGRVAVEDFLRLLIEPFGVPPRNVGWKETLGRTKGRFDSYEGW